MPSPVEDQIDKKIGEVRTESLDMSFGELIGLHSSGELIITPEYQRLFRWSEEQQSRLIESILLELPIPQIFVVENQDGRFELIDGLQRVSSVMHFVEPEKLGTESLRLFGCDIIPALNKLTYSELPTRLRFRIKRAPVRVTVIKRQSTHMLRYEMFKRLNTGGSALMPQEIRNCTARMIGDPGISFYAFLTECAHNESFVTCTATLSESDREQKGDEELVLRFFAVKNAPGDFAGSVRDWLDDYMEAVILGRSPFNYSEQRKDFLMVFEFLAAGIGDIAFVRFRDDRPIGGLAPAYFEAVAGGSYKAMKRMADLDPQTAKAKIIAAVQTDAFRECTGPGANARWKLVKRVEIIEEAISENR
jgi:hypothetical protein